VLYPLSYSGPGNTFVALVARHAARTSF